MIKAIIFDVDGVLLDNRKEVKKIFQKTGKELGLGAPPISELKKTFGLPWEEMLKILFGNANENTKKIYAKNWLELEPKMKIMKHSSYVLRRLKIRKAVVTSKRRSKLKRQINDLMRFFEVIISKEDTKKHKPNPEPLLLACKRLNLKPNETVYIGDAIIDYEAARNAETNFIGFISGSATKKEFKKLNARYITSLKELLKEFQ